MAESIGNRKKLKSDSSSRSSNAISWQSWADKYSLPPGTGIKEQTTDVVKIFAKDVGLYGLSPRYEDICLVVCRVCKQIYKMQALYGHYERRHAERLSQVLHQTMSSRKDYYGSSSSNTSLAHSSSTGPTTLEKFSSSMHGSPISKAKPLEPLLPSLESSDHGRMNQDKSREKFKPAEKINHSHEKNYQGLNATAGISSSVSSTNATSGNIPSSRSQPIVAPSSSNSVVGGPKKPSAFHFPGFIARKSMSNIFPVEPGSSAVNSNSENSSRIISQTVSIKKTTLDSTSVYDFDDLSVSKQPSTDHGKYSTKNNKLKDLGLPEKVETKMTKVSPCDNRDKDLSTFSKGFKTPDHVSVSLKNSSHPHTLLSKDASHVSTTHKKHISSKTSSPSKSSKLDTPTPNHKANLDKVVKTVYSSMESNHKIMGKKDDSNEKCGSLSKPKSSLSSQPLSPEKYKHKKNNGPEPPISSALSKKEFISPNYTSSANNKLKKRVDDIYSSSSPSSLSSRCSTPQSKKQEVSQMKSSSSPLSSCKPAFSPNQVSHIQKVERSKKLSEMSKRDLLLNAKKSAKKMSPKVGNRHSVLADNLSSDDEDEVLPSSNRCSGSFKKMELKNTLENSTLYVSKEQKRTSKSRFSIDSNSDSSISDSELTSLSGNCISLGTKAPSKTKKVIISDSCMENEIIKQTDRIHRASPKFSSDGFSLSSSRKRSHSSDDEDPECFGSSGRSTKKQKTLKSQQSLETSPLPNKKTQQSSNQPSLSPGGTGRKLQGVSKTLKFEVNTSPVSNIKQNFNREKRVKDSLHGDSKRNSLMSERCHQLQHGSRLHSFPSPSSSSEPVDSLDSPLSRTPANQNITSTKQSKKHIGAELPSSLHLEGLSNAVGPYQPDIHCGVLINSKFPCMNSLSCQEHSISLRRAVGGRSKAFDLLLLSQTSKPRHHSPSHRHAPSSSYSVLIPSPPSSYVNPAASSNTSTSSFSHPVTGAAPEGIQNRTRVKSKKQASHRSLSSSSSSSASPPRSTFHKYEKESNFSKVLSPQRSSPKSEVVGVELCQMKMEMNSTNPEIKDGVVSVEQLEQLETHKLESDSESTNKELIEKLLKDGQIGKGEEDFNEDYDDDDDYTYGEVFRLGVCGLQESLIRPSSFESLSKKKFQRPKKLLKHGTGGNLVLIGSENQGNNTNITNGDTSTILERHPKPIAVNTFGSWNLATSSSSGLFAFRKQDLVRQAFQKIVHRASKADSSPRLQNNQLWRRKSMNFPVRINSCLLRPEPSDLRKFTNGDCSDSEEFTVDEPLDDGDPNEQLNAIFRDLAPPAAFLKSFQSSQCKIIRSNQIPTTSKPSQCQSNNQNLTHSDDNMIGVNHCSSIHKKSHSTSQMTELPQFLPSFNPVISATVSKGSDKIIPQTLVDHRDGMRSPPHKKRISEIMPCTTCHPLTEAVVVPCCSTMSISDNATTLSSSQAVSYTFYPSQNAIQNTKTFNDISNSRGTCPSPKDGQGKYLAAKGIHLESDSQVCTKEMRCEKPAFNAKLSCSPCSTLNGIPKDNLHSKSHSTKTFLTPSKFQQNGFVSSMSSTAHNMPPPSLVPNNYSVPFRNPSFSQSTNVLSSFLNSSQPSTKGLPVSSPLNGMPFPTSSTIYKNNNLPYLNSCPSSTLNQLKPLNSVSSLEGAHKIQFKTADGATVLSPGDLHRHQMPQPESIQPAVFDRKQKPSRHLHQQSQQMGASQNHQHITVKNNDHQGHAKHPLNLVNGVDSLGSSLNHSHLQAPLASNLVNHNRHHIMNIIGSSLPTQNLIYNQQQQCQLAQDVPIFHKSFPGGFSDQAKNHSSGEKPPVQDFDALSNVDQIKQTSGKMNASSRTRKAMVGI